MVFITTDEAKNYLRVDSYYDDDLISNLLVAAEALCRDVAKLSDDDWSEICDRNAEETSTLSQRRNLMRIAILYALGYFYEHREEANHLDLTLTLRNILFALREDKLL